MKTQRFILFVLFVALVGGCTGQQETLDGGGDLSGCSASSDCAAGEVCLNGVCEAPLCVGDECDESCERRAECPAGLVCRDGECIEPDGSCESNEECLEGFVCDGIFDTCVDLNPPEDAGVPPVLDAGETDAGDNIDDAGRVEDGGMPFDAGQAIDSGSVVDGGDGQDAGLTDGGNMDAGQPEPDAGINPAAALCSSFDYANGKAQFLALSSGTEVTSLEGQGNDFDQPCASELAAVGEEAVFYIYLDTNETMYFNASVNTNADLIVYIIEDCLNPICVAGFDSGSGGAAEAHSFTNDGLFRDFYIIVDEWAVSSSGLDYGEMTFDYCTTESSSCP